MAASKPWDPMDGDGYAVFGPTDEARSMRMFEMGRGAGGRRLAAMRIRNLVGLLLMLAACNTILGYPDDPVLVQVDSGGGSDTSGG